MGALWIEVVCFLLIRNSSLDIQDLSLSSFIYLFLISNKYNMKMFRKFILYRTEDVCGVSGTGKVAEGIQFSSGKCVISWISDTPSVEVYDNIEGIELIHGHHGKTEIRWIDNT